MNKLYCVNPSLDGLKDCAMAIFDNDGTLLRVIDIHHGDTLNEDLLIKNGYEIEHVSLSQVLGDSLLFIIPDFTNEVPHQEKLVQEMPKWLRSKDRNFVILKIDAA